MDSEEVKKRLLKGHPKRRFYYYLEKLKFWKYPNKLDGGDVK